MEEERWAICPLAPEYEVSTYGKVRWVKDKKWVRIGTNNGYPIVYRSKKITDTPNAQQLYVHRMVAITFIGGYGDGLVVNHIDGCRFNNRADNLEWVTAQDNISNRYNANRRYTQEDIDLWYDEIRLNNLTQNEIAKKYDSTQAYVGVLLSNNVSTKDIDPIKLLYHSKMYTIKEIASIYNVKVGIIEKLLQN